jgi:hypothetical protein
MAASDVQQLTTALRCFSERPFTTLQTKQQNDRSKKRAKKNSAEWDQRITHVIHKSA